MQRLRVQLRSGPRADTAGSGSEEEWRDAVALKRAEAEQHGTAPTGLIWLVPTAVLAALLPAMFPLTPGFSAAETQSSGPTRFREHERYEMRQSPRTSYAAIGRAKPLSSRSPTGAASTCSSTVANTFCPIRI